MGRTPLFLGLVQPPRFLGLPATYALAWVFGTALGMLWVQHWAVLGVAAAAYPALWKVADWDPHAIDVWLTVMGQTPSTRNRAIHGGHSYAP